MVYLFKIHVPRSLFRFIYVMFNERSLLINETCVFCCICLNEEGDLYGFQMIRGQYLTGKDFSYQTLMKQDFKMIRLSLR
jgi:hypothetical protein